MAKGLTEELEVLSTVILHRAEVQDALATVIHRLEQRSRRHDLSKFREDELAGFARIQRVAKAHPYGSPEYRAALREERPTIALHYSRNSYNPEYHRSRKDGEAANHCGLTLLDLIELTADWKAIWAVHNPKKPDGSEITWEEMVDKNVERYSDLTDTQAWVIREVAGLLGNG